MGVGQMKVLHIINRLGGGGSGKITFGNATNLK